MLTRHLVIFARLPKLGAGKRRLARDIGTVQALRFQRVMQKLLLHRFARDRRWRTWLAVTPDRSGPWPQYLAIVRQGRGDLGRRMARVARQMPPGPVVIIGSDIPGITTQHIAEAFNRLGYKDAVFGPAEDGGYWLVGLRRRPCFVDPFGGVAWSTPTTLRDTLVNLESCNIALVDMLEDVDDRESLARHKRWYLLSAVGQRRVPTRGWCT